MIFILKRNVLVKYQGADYSNRFNKRYWTQILDEKNAYYY